MNPGVACAGVSFSGGNIAQYAGRYLEVERHPDGSVEIKTVY
jgi:hypothetical protein